MTESIPRAAMPLPPTAALPRRRLLCSLGVGVLAGVAGRSVSAAPGEAGDGPIVQPRDPEPKAFLARAFALRQRALELGDQPYGAVVVRAGRIIGESVSRVVIDFDPTGHAELSALRDAGRRERSASLSGAVLYSSSRPCPMCEAAAYWAGIAEMIHGRDGRSAGAPRLCG